MRGVKMGRLKWWGRLSRPRQDREQSVAEHPGRGVYRRYPQM